MSALEHQGVDPGYAHGPKLARPEPSTMLGDALLKWYDIAPDDDPVPLKIRANARRSLHDAVSAGDLTLGDDTGFVILHRSSESFYFLLVSTWRNDNELWQSVWAKDTGDAAFRRWQVESDHRPTFCVWELGVVAYERESWTRFLHSGRDETARREYLRDCYIGAV
jgi:hypothetical protein